MRPSWVTSTRTVVLGRLEVGRGELAAEPLELRRVLMEPRVAFGGRGDAASHHLAEGFDLFAGDKADTPFSDERFGDGRGPVARARRLH
jgi:hypothetical protein